MYAVVNTKVSWNSTVELSKEAYAELMFWNQNVDSLNFRLGYFRVYRQNLFTPTRQIMPLDPLSRMKTVELALISVAPSLRGTQIAWFTDNTNVVTAVL